MAHWGWIRGWRAPDRGAWPWKRQVGGGAGAGVAHLGGLHALRDGAREGGGLLVQGRCRGLEAVEGSHAGGTGGGSGGRGHGGLSAERHDGSGRHRV